MSHLLHIDSSARNAGSLTRQLSAQYAAAWKSANPEGTVTYRDVSLQAPAFVSEDWITGVFAPPEYHTADSAAAVSAAEELIREVEAADVLLLGVPVYNFNVPAAFKAWIDQIFMAGRTFAYGSEGPQGLLAGKKAIVIRASGSDFDDPAFAAMDFHAPYLRSALAFVGITDVEFISVNGMASPQLEAALDKGTQAIEASLAA
ncbi:FMN-dependent NADH-azoreductase [Streptomyces sp. NBC_01483]|uniref:FMN-dependent NADH-azoreductase n=1 Tax=Streptomyces sp. NBC_01483 TaxID=2903883 RepID=UPI002E310B59|nr:NAD(P)H-dependent oxidoreductase [Streptomyces sp. NBC_01483]